MSFGDPWYVDMAGKITLFPTFLKVITVDVIFEGTAKQDQQVVVAVYLMFSKRS